MAAPVQKVQTIKLPASTSTTTPDNRYWRSYKSPLHINSYASITHINFAPSTPYDIVVSSAARVQIFSSKTRTVSKTISRFKDTVYSANIRSDGRILVAGDKSGVIQIFDIGSRAILKTFDQHKQPVQTTKFSPMSATTVLSTSDDTTVRLWDIATQDPTHTFLGHTDYVRAGAFLPGSSGTVISGSYDGKVKLWDPRISTTEGNGGCVMTFSHEHAIESVLPMTGGTTILSSAGNAIHVLDIVAAKVAKTMSNHQKTVTSLAHASGGRVLSGGLDGHVKIYETREWKVVHGIKYPQPILALGVSPDDKHLVVGMVNGLLSIRTRATGEKKKDTLTQIGMLADLGIDAVIAKEKKEKSSNYKRMIRGMDYKGGDEDIIIKDVVRQKKLSKWEVMIRKSNYAAALDEVLNGKYPPLTVLTLLKVLIYHSALNAALRNRDEVTLQPILRWLTKYIAEPRYADLIVQVTLLLLDMYEHALGRSPQIDGLVKKLAEKVNVEVAKAKRVNEARGMLELLMAGNGAI